jgi:ferredoxin-NADP reductase
VVPLMAMLRACVQDRSDIPVRYLSSARSHDDLIYRSELESIASPEHGIAGVLHNIFGWEMTNENGCCATAER